MSTETIKPSDGELAILGVLWASGPSTVRQVHDALGGRSAYTSTLKTMQVMLEKGHVDRDASTRSHSYWANLDEQSTKAGLLTQLADKAFAGSAAALMVCAIEGGQLSAAELTSLRKLLDAEGAKR